MNNLLPDNPIELELDNANFFSLEQLKKNTRQHKVVVSKNQLKLLKIPKSKEIKEIKHQRTRYY